MWEPAIKANTEIVEHYSRLFADYGSAWKAADCGSQATHNLRLRVLSGIFGHYIGAQPPISVLDVGCGLGSLNADLPWRTQYEGWDLSTVLVEAARECWSSKFYVRDLYLSTETSAYDYVVASGLFQFADDARMRAGVRRMWELCRKGVAFNFLTKSDGTPDETAHGPIGTLAFCMSLTPKVVLGTDYLPNDATIYLYR